MMTARQRTRLYSGIAGWTLALCLFFPIFWMVVTSFKTEAEAIGGMKSLFFVPTLENYAAINERANYESYLLNSVVVSFSATVLALAIALPTVYSMVFFPTGRTKDVLMWILSTKMLPPVGVLVPIYLMFKSVHLIDSKTALIVVYTFANLPIVVWMLYSFFKDVPGEIIEASRMDGATTLQQIRLILVPLTLPGITSTGLLSVILCWNEAFWSINLTSTAAAPLTSLVASFSSPEGLFWAKLSAVSSLAVAPIIIFGWITQKQLVRGLTFGAVK
ncbi:ABC transporter permease subunit [Rhizobium leguminosarum bv. viciae]|uniref:carbohydrate ABC transporter permease n=1 Tax=Rhizobium leguminosarum TaxID=384 RepID=UPI0019DD3490|nr:carbohydrate ABC transporter permease [Rhizobium leguminosarum]NKL73193.1 ABC transporter permease subunit [Rhizobium leguminosarum bv. viciae]